MKLMGLTFHGMVRAGMFSKNITKVLNLISVIYYNVKILKVNIKLTLIN